MTKNIFCLLCVKSLVKILFLYITVKLDFDIDRKSANFDFKNPQNISVDQIITELSTFSCHYELVMHFSWNPKDSHNRYELYLAWWNRTLIYLVSILCNMYICKVYCFVHCVFSILYSNRNYNFWPKLKQTSKKRRVYKSLFFSQLNQIIYNYCI